jgi:penicillin-binding protein 1A
VWADVMTEALKEGYQSTIPKAEPMKAKVQLCRVSGQLATDSCRARRYGYSDELPPELVPQDFCSVHGGSGPRGAAPEKKDGFFSRLFRWFR